MRVSHETCRDVCRNIIKLYVVASCWTIIDITFTIFVLKAITINDSSKRKMKEYKKASVVDNVLFMKLQVYRTGVNVGTSC